MSIEDMELPEDPQEEQSTEGAEEITVETAPGKIGRASCRERV